MKRLGTSFGSCRPWELRNVPPSLITFTTLILNQLITYLLSASLLYPCLSALGLSKLTLASPLTIHHTRGVDLSTYVILSFLILLLCEPSTLSVVFHVDSGAGQSLCSCADAFVSLRLRACAIEVIGIGVAGSLPIFYLRGGKWEQPFLPSPMPLDRLQAIIVQIHNYLLSQGGTFNLQLQPP